MGDSFLCHSSGKVPEATEQQNIWYSCPKGIPDGMFQTDNLCSIILLKPI